MYKDVRRARPHSHADADFAGPLGDADEHDVHDADAADHERHRRDASEQKAHRTRSGRDGLHQFQLVAHGEILFLAAMPGEKQIRDVILHAVYDLVVGGLHQNVVHECARGDAVHVARVWDDNRVVLILSEKIKAFGT